MRVFSSHLCNLPQLQSVTVIEFKHNDIEHIAFTCICAVNQNLHFYYRVVVLNNVSGEKWNSKMQCDSHWQCTSLNMLFWSKIESILQDNINKEYRTWPYKIRVLTIIRVNTLLHTSILPLRHVKKYSHILTHSRHLPNVNKLQTVSNPHHTSSSLQLLYCARTMLAVERSIILCDLSFVHIFLNRTTSKHLYMH